MNNKFLAIGVGEKGCSGVHYLKKVSPNVVDYMAFSNKSLAISRGYRTIHLGRASDYEAKIQQVSARYQLAVLLVDTTSVVSLTHTENITLAIDPNVVSVSISIVPCELKEYSRSSAKCKVERYCHLTDADMIFNESKCARMVVEDGLTYGAKMFTDLVSGNNMIDMDVGELANALQKAGIIGLSRGVGVGKDRARFAAVEAVSEMEPEEHLKKAGTILFKIEGPPSLSLEEVNQAASVISKSCRKNANIMFSVSQNSEFQDQIVLTLLATQNDRLN